MRLESWAFLLFHFICCKMLTALVNHNLSRSHANLEAGSVHSFNALMGMQIAPLPNGRIQMQYRRVTCTAPDPITVRVDGNNGPGLWLRLWIEVSLCSTPFTQHQTARQWHWASHIWQSWRTAASDNASNASNAVDVDLSSANLACGSKPPASLMMLWWSCPPAPNLLRPRVRTIQDHVGPSVLAPGMKSLAAIGIANHVAHAQAEEKFGGKMPWRLVW